MSEQIQIICIKMKEEETRIPKITLHLRDDSGEKASAPPFSNWAQQLPTTKSTRYPSVIGNPIFFSIFSLLTLYSLASGSVISGRFIELLPKSLPPFFFSNIII
jgi:hypothetical protein